MQLHELVRSKGLKTKARRKGRGNASKGNTSGRGNKGQGQRAGHSQKPFFEGGQTPLVQRIPKLRGFKRYYKLIDEYKVVNIGDLEKDERVTKEVNKELLTQRWYLKKPTESVKVLGTGELTKELSFENLEKYSKSAEAKIEKAGWKISLIVKESDKTKKESKKI